ncbi:MAG: hypothetical protein R2758_01815 [Bacteroidales bacterium]
MVNSMDTTVPMHLRPPSTSPSEERMYPEDLKWYIYFDDLAGRITGYERAGDVYNDYGGGQPLFGHGPDFGYWYYGAIWMVTSCGTGGDTRIMTVTETRTRLICWPGMMRERRRRIL